ncbi:MAG: tetratricopeptide repeat protein, partial [Chloroflexota bacterium]
TICVAPSTTADHSSRRSCPTTAKVIVQIAERFKQAGQRNINTELTGVQMLANAHYRQGNLTDAAKYQTDLVTILREINHPDTEKFERILYNTTQEIHKKTSLM